LFARLSLWAPPGNFALARSAGMRPGQGWEWKCRPKAALGTDSPAPPVLPQQQGVMRRPPKKSDSPPDCAPLATQWLPASLLWLRAAFGAVFKPNT